ncbi:MAG: tRNA (guanine-N(7)-)-methyltransferase [Polyangiaceae bacterium]|jgi:tRNA (guanine-N7-)-methyltransferase|nr:tRNA (guanine-N(7)-)-methyltransferase [Polyangiaceae bacterium]
MKETAVYKYAHAPRLPSSGPIEVATLTQAVLPLEVEIGPGRGMFLLERAEECHDVALVGLEIRWKWAAIVDERLRRIGLDGRARVFAEDIRFLLPRLRPAGSVRAFFVHFPDPWWKKKQEKRLVVVPNVVREMARLLEPGGMLFVQTDVEDRAHAYESVLAGTDELANDGNTPGTARLSECPWSAKGNREKRVLEAGLQPFRLRYRRR